MGISFFARFNLHNSLSANPISTEILKPLLNTSDEKITAMLCEIEKTQNERADRLRKKHPEQAVLLGGKRVLFLGDSITSDNLGYRETVTRAAGLVGIDGSVSGGTSSMILHTARMLIEKARPDIVSVMIGSNDSVSIERRELNSVSIGEYERNVEEIVCWASGVGAAILLFEIPPVVEERFEKQFSPHSKLQSNVNINTYNEALKRIAERNRIKLQSNAWLSEDVGYYEPDGIHLSICGQELFSEKWLELAAKITKGE